MIRDVWKKFDEADLTHSSVHHLLAVQTLKKEHGYVRGTDIAGYLQITRGSVSITIKKLKDKGYIEEDQNKFLSLSDKGAELVNAVLTKRRMVEKFLAQVLGVSPELAEEDACKIEHLLTQETSLKLLSFMGYFFSDSKEARLFRKRFEKFSYDCLHHEESCSICEIECFFAHNEEAIKGADELL